MVKCFEKLVFAILKSRVERFAIKCAIIIVKQTNVAKTSTDLAIHFDATNDQLDSFDSQYPVDSCEGLCSREVYTVDVVKIQDKKTYRTALELILQHVPDLVLDTDNRAKEQIAGQLHDMGLLSSALQETMLNRMSSNRRIRDASWKIASNS